MGELSELAAEPSRVMVTNLNFGKLLYKVRVHLPKAVHSWKLGHPKPDVVFV